MLRTGHVFLGKVLLLLIWKIDINYLLCTASKVGSVRICVSVAFLPIIAMIVEPIAGLATVSILVADFHHNITISSSMVLCARLGDNA